MKGIVILILFMSLFSLDSFAQSERELASVLASNSCDYKVEILADGDEFDSQDFKWQMRATKIEGKSTNITGTAEIESDGNTIKSYKPWTSDSIAKQKTSNEYSPNLKPGSYGITAEISVECDDTNKDNNIDKKEITIKGAKETKTEEVEETEPPKKKSAKNNEAALESTAKTVSEPKSQPSQSSSKQKSIEEFDNVIELKPQNSQKTQETQMTAKAIQNPEVIYESSSERAKGWIMIFLLTLSILLNIVLIWKR